MTIAILIAAALGLVDSLYLLWKRYARPHRPLVCPIGENCQTVLASRYGSLLGFRNEFLGAGYYSALLLLLAVRGDGVLLGAIGLDPLALATILSTIAFAVSVLLTAIQIFTLKNYCSYCLFANALNAFIFVVLVLR